MTEFWFVIFMAGGQGYPSIQFVQGPFWYAGRPGGRPLRENFNWVVTAGGYGYVPLLIR